MSQCRRHQLGTGRRTSISPARSGMTARWIRRRGGWSATSFRSSFGRCRRCPLPRRSGRRSQYGQSRRTAHHHHRQASVRAPVSASRGRCARATVFRVGDSVKILEAGAAGSRSFRQRWDLRASAAGRQGDPHRRRAGGVRARHRAPCEGPSIRSGHGRRVPRLRRGELRHSTAGARGGSDSRGSQGQQRRTAANWSKKLRTPAT